MPTNELAAGLMLGVRPPRLSSLSGVVRLTDLISP